MRKLTVNGFQQAEKLSEYKVEVQEGNENTLWTCIIYDENGDYVYMCFYPNDDNTETLTTLTYTSGDREISISDNYHISNSYELKTFDKYAEPSRQTVTSVDTLKEFMFSDDANSETNLEITETSVESSTEIETITQSNFIVDYDFISSHQTDIVVAAKLALDRFVSDYKMSLAPQLWTIALFDDSGAVMATTDMTYNGVTGKYIYVGTLNVNEDEKVESATPHYVYAMGVVLGDDGYCDDFFETINDIVN